MTRLFLLLVIVLCMATGCAGSQGLSRDRLEAVLQQEASRFAATSPSTGNPTRPSAPVLGLYLKPTGFLHREFEWSVRDRDMMLAWSRQLPRAVIDRSAGFVPMSSLKGNSFTELRSSAARYGVDWILIVDGAAAVDRYNNYKAPLLYWTIFGAYLADGTHSDALCLLKATLWDVKTGTPLFDEQADAITRTLGPAALVNDNREIERAKSRAMETLLQRLTDRFAMSLGTGR